MKTFLIPIIIFSLCAIILNIYSNVNHILPYMGANIEGVNFNSTRPTHINKEYIKNQIDDIFNCNYILTYKNLNDGYNGVSYIMLKVITLDNDLSLEEFTMTLTHELVHITYFTANERFTSFKAFQILYESGNEYFKNVALSYADIDLKGLMGKEYSCAGYIERYLANNSSIFEQ